MKKTYFTLFLLMLILGTSTSMMAQKTISTTQGEKISTISTQGDNSQKIATTSFVHTTLGSIYKRECSSSYQAQVILTAAESLNSVFELNGTFSQSFTLIFDKTVKKTWIIKNNNTTNGLVYIQYPTGTMLYVYPGKSVMVYGDGSNMYYADNAYVTDAISPSERDFAPSQRAVNNALVLKAPLISPMFSGIPEAPTATPGTDSKQLATTAFVKNAVTGTSWLKSGNEGTAGTDFIGTTDAMDLVFKTTNTEQMRITAGGNVTFTKNITSANSFTTSDIRLKKNVKELKNALETVKALRAVSYEKKTSIDAAEYTIKEDGFIAQEVRKVLPELVSEMNDADKTLTVNYTAIIPILTKAIQEQQAQIEAQQAQINMLIKEIKKSK